MTKQDWVVGCIFTLAENEPGMTLTANPAWLGANSTGPCLKCGGPPGKCRCWDGVVMTVAPHPS